MKLIIFLTILFSITTSFGQTSLRQDPPGINWRSVENDHFKVVFPDYAKKEGNYILNLLNYYKPIVDKSYEQTSKKLTVVLRTGLSQPNGFVTLAPRRSEWFLSRVSSPLIGSLEWLQALAVHEYRHVAQLDFLNRSNNKLAYILGGEALLGTVISITMPTWFLEGDATWTETVYTNAGRGRSPRFSKRLRALLVSDQDFSLDQIIAGDFTNPLPGIYRFGYFLITKGINDYGEKFWRDVVARASDKPLNPYALYNAFREITGRSFESFYLEMMDDLKKKWKKDTKLSHDQSDYQQYAYPIQDGEKLYFLKRDLNHFWRLFAKTENKPAQLIREFDVDPELSRVDLRDNHFLYTQILPDRRYSFKSYSDLFIYDIGKRKLKRLSKKKRFYQPQFNRAGDKFLAIEFTKKNQWNINLYTRDGKKYKTLRANERHQFVEAVWANDNEIYAISLAPDGQKRIIHINLGQEKYKITTLSNPTRNNLYSLHFHKDSLYFEADDKGKVNILSLNLKTTTLSRCTQTQITAQHPHVVNSKLFHITETANGSRVKSIDLDCNLIEKDFIQLSEKYLGAGPSDTYHKSKPVKIKDFKKLISTKQKDSSYNEYKSSLRPHSWGIGVGRGTQVFATTTNILNSLNLTGSLGRDPSEETTSGGINLTYSKFYPIFNLSANINERANQVSEDERISWNEAAYRASITLPYLFRNHLYNGSYLLTAFGEHISVGDSEGATENIIDNENLTGSGFSLSFSYRKAILNRELAPRYGFDLTYFYEDITATNNDTFNSYFSSIDSNLFLPGLSDLHSIHLSYSAEFRPENRFAYRVQDQNINVLSYNFSRGYTYEFTPRFEKLTFEYDMPLAYPNIDLWNLAFFRRITGRVFFDSTLVDFEQSPRTLNSSGIELEFNTFLLRKLPINIGTRFIRRLSDNQQQTEIYFTL